MSSKSIVNHNKSQSNKYERTDTMEKQVAYWQTMINKYEKRNSDLEEKVWNLQDRSECINYSGHEGKRINTSQTIQKPRICSKLITIPEISQCAPYKPVEQKSDLRNHLILLEECIDKLCKLVNQKKLLKCDCNEDPTNTVIVEANRRVSEELEVLQHCAYKKQNMNALQSQFDCICKKQLNEQMCVLQSKYNKLQKDLLQRKLGQASALQGVSSMKQAMGDYSEIRDKVIESDSLNAIARKLSGTLMELEKCDHCKTIPADFKETIRGIKQVLDLINNYNRNERRSSTSLVLLPKTTSQSDLTIMTSIRSRVDVSVQKSECRVSIDVATEISTSSLVSEEFSDIESSEITSQQLIEALDGSMIKYASSPTLKTIEHRSVDRIKAKVVTEICEEIGDDYNITSTTTESGTVEVITESPEGIIETTVTYTESGNIDISTEMIKFNDVPSQDSTFVSTESSLSNYFAELPYSMKTTTEISIGKESTITKVVSKFSANDSTDTLRDKIEDKKRKELEDLQLPVDDYDVLAKSEECKKVQALPIDVKSEELQIEDKKLQAEDIELPKDDDDLLAKSEDLKTEEQKLLVAENVGLPLLTRSEELEIEGEKMIAEDVELPTLTKIKAEDVALPIDDEDHLTTSEDFQIERQKLLLPENFGLPILTKNEELQIEGQKLLAEDVALPIDDEDLFQIKAEDYELPMDDDDELLAKSEDLQIKGQKLLAENVALPIDDEDLFKIEDKTSQAEDYELPMDDDDELLAKSEELQIKGQKLQAEDVALPIDDEDLFKIEDKTSQAEDYELPMDDDDELLAKSEELQIEGEKLLAQTKNLRAEYVQLPIDDDELLANDIEIVQIEITEQIEITIEIQPKEDKSIDRTTVETDLEISIVVAEDSTKAIFSDVEMIKEEYFDEDPFTVEDLRKEILHKQVGEAIEKANKEVMDALYLANKNVTEALEKVNNDVRAALSLAVKDTILQANKLIYTTIEEEEEKEETIPRESKPKMIEVTQQPEAEKEKETNLQNEEEEEEEVEKVDIEKLNEQWKELTRTASMGAEYWGAMFNQEAQPDIPRLPAYTTLASRPKLFLCNDVCSRLCRKQQNMKNELTLSTTSFTEEEWKEIWIAEKAVKDRIYEISIENLLMLSKTSVAISPPEEEIETEMVGVISRDISYFNLIAEIVTPTEIINVSNAEKDEIKQASIEEITDGPSQDAVIVPETPICDVIVEEIQQEIEPSIVSPKQQVSTTPLVEEQIVPLLDNKSTSHDEMHSPVKPSSHRSSRDRKRSRKSRQSESERPKPPLEIEVVFSPIKPAQRTRRSQEVPQEVKECKDICSQSMTTEQISPRKRSKSSSDKKEGIHSSRRSSRKYSSKPSGEPKSKSLEQVTRSSLKSSDVNKIDHKLAQITCDCKECNCEICAPEKMKEREAKFLGDCTCTLECNCPVCSFLFPKLQMTDANESTKDIGGHPPNCECLECITAGEKITVGGTPRHLEACDCLMCRCCKYPTSDGKQKGAPPMQCLYEKVCAMEENEQDPQTSTVISKILSTSHAPTESASTKISIIEIPTDTTHLSTTGTSHPPECNCYDCLLTRSSASTPSKTVKQTHSECLNDINTVSAKERESHHETLGKALTQLENEFRQQKKEIIELQKKIKETSHIFQQVETNSTLEQSFVAIKKSSFHLTLSGLKLALSAIQSKCNTKDRMIATMAKELDVRKAELIPDLIIPDNQPIPDYDRTEICNLLPRPTREPQERPNVTIIFQGDPRTGFSSATTTLSSDPQYDKLLKKPTGDSSENTKLGKEIIIEAGTSTHDSSKCKCNVHKAQAQLNSRPQRPNKCVKPQNPNCPQHGINNTHQKKPSPKLPPVDQLRQHKERMSCSRPKHIQQSTEKKKSPVIQTKYSKHTWQNYKPISADSKRPTIQPNCKNNTPCTACRRLRPGEQNEKKRLETNSDTTNIRKGQCSNINIDQQLGEHKRKKCSKTQMAKTYLHSRSRCVKFDF